MSLEVRDYECDLQGIVNNAVYLHYLEHARHQYLRAHGLSFAELTKTGVHLVVIQMEIEYRLPLRSGDQFLVTSRLEQVSIVRFAFLQEIVRLTPPVKPLEDGMSSPRGKRTVPRACPGGSTGDRRAVAARARVVCAAMDTTGKPIRPTVLDPLFQTTR